jgi:hypothetical protein
MPREQSDSLEFEATCGGGLSSPQHVNKSVGDDSTAGDLGSSLSDLGEFDVATEFEMEVVDLAVTYSQSLYHPK